MTRLSCCHSEERNMWKTRQNSSIKISDKLHTNYNLVLQNNVNFSYYSDFVIVSTLSSTLPTFIIKLAINFTSGLEIKSETRFSFSYDSISIFRVLPCYGSSPARCSMMMWSGRSSIRGSVSTSLKLKLRNSAEMNTISPVSATGKVNNN